MNITVITGRMYNGTVHGWTDTNVKPKQERSCYRGRLNFRLPNGEYAWMDAVCFKDNPHTEANGLVGFLEEHFLDDGDGSTGHGRAVEIQGWLKPAEKFKTHTVKIKGGGSKDIPDIPYDSWEIVIDSASFVPTSQGETNSGGSRRGNAAVDEDFDLDDDADDEMDLEDDEQDEAPPVRNRGNGGRSSSSTGRSNSSSTGGRSGSGSRSSGNRSNSGTGSSRSERRGSGNSSSSTGGRSGGSSSSKKDKARTGGTGGGKPPKDKDFFVE